MVSPMRFCGITIWYFPSHRKMHFLHLWLQESQLNAHLNYCVLKSIIVFLLRIHFPQAAVRQLLSMAGILRWTYYWERRDGSDDRPWVCKAPSALMNIHRSKLHSKKIFFSFHVFFISQTCVADRWLLAPFPLFTDLFFP